MIYLFPLIMSSSAIMNRALKYGSAGAATFGGLYYLSGKAEDMVIVSGVRVPLWAVGLGLGVASSVANDFVHSMVLANIPVDAKLESMAGTATSLASGGSTTLAFAYLLQPKLLTDVGAGKLFLVGAAAEVLGEWGYQQISKWMGYSQSELLM